MSVQGLVLIAVVASAIVAVLRFEQLCLSRLANTSDAGLRYLTRAGWIAVIVCVIPLGGLAFLYYGSD